jgi:hypothetical protein
MHQLVIAVIRVQLVLIKRMVDRRLWLEKILQGQQVRLDEFPQGEGFDEMGDGGHAVAFNC